MRKFRIAGHMGQGQSRGWTRNNCDIPSLRGFLQPITNIMAEKCSRGCYSRVDAVSSIRIIQPVSRSGDRK